jgi:hypothetical protein
MIQTNQLLLTYLLKGREDRTVLLKYLFTEDFEGTYKHYLVKVGATQFFDASNQDNKRTICGT